MTAVIRRPIVAMVTHAREVPAAERGRFAETLRADGRTPALVLETCHRVEAYTVRRDGIDGAPADIAIPDGGRVLVGDEAVRHAITVAAGRDSVVRGEDQILHQIRVSVGAARSSGGFEPELDRLFAMALQAGRRARSWRTGRQRSMADLALQVVADAVGPLRGLDVLVVGAGKMGGLLARAAAAAGTTVTVANRSVGTAHALSAGIGGRISEVDPGADVGRFAAIFVALGGPWVIHGSTIAAIVERRPALVDLSVPIAVPASLVEALRGRMITADDLARREAVAAPDPGAVDPRTDALIEQTVRAYLEWSARGDARAAADALVRRADLEREAELAALWKRVPMLDPVVREEIEGMTRHLTARLLRHPLERLGRAADESDGRAVRDLFAL